MSNDEKSGADLRCVCLRVFVRCPPQCGNGSEAIDQMDRRNMCHLVWFLSLLLFVVVCRLFGLIPLPSHCSGGQTEGRRVNREVKGQSQQKRGKACAEE